MKCLYENIVVCFSILQTNSSLVELLMDLSFNLDEFDQVIGRKTKLYSLIEIILDLLFILDKFDEFVEPKKEKKKEQ